MRVLSGTLLAALHLISCAPAAPATSPDAEGSAPSSDAPAPDDERAGAQEPVATEPPPTESDSPKSATSEESEQDWLRVGAVTDGATLTAAEVQPGPGKGATLVLGFDGQGQPPATRARVENPKLVTVVVEGVRGVKANLPLVTGEGFRVIGQPRKIERGTIQSIGRGFYGDDSGIRIDVELSAPSTIELVPGAAGRSVELRVTPAS